MLPFLTEPPKQPMLKDFSSISTAPVKVCGEDHVGIGSDIPFLHVGEEELAELKRRSEERKAAGIAAPGEDRPAYIPDLNTERKLRARDRCIVEARLQKRSGRKNPGRKFQAGPGRHLVGVITQALTD